jgi:hypothetical protein
LVCSGSSAWPCRDATAAVDRGRLAAGPALVAAIVAAVLFWRTMVAMA